MKTKTFFVLLLLRLVLNASVSAQVQEIDTTLRLDMTLEELCDCSIKVKLWGRKLWLGKNNTAEQLLSVLLADGQVLRTKQRRDRRWSKELSRLEDDFWRELLPLLIAEGALSDCQNWWCRLTKGLETILIWILQRKVNPPVG
ncbi:MAG: hypothetical protein AAFW73_20490 [Bacteroidota bacterium]